MNYGNEVPAEREVLQVVDSHFRVTGYRILEGIQVRTWRPDLVAVKDDEIIICEVKGRSGDLRRALAQTALYAYDATAAYLAVPTRRVSKWLKRGCEILGVGLMAVGDDVATIIPPERSTPRESFAERVREELEAPSPGKTREDSQMSRLRLGRLLRHRKLLEVLMSNPGRRFTIRELSRASGVTYATTWRIVEDLSNLGVLTAERVGPSRQITLNPHSPLLADLEQLSELELSPHRKAAQEFSKRASGLAEVSRVILFGSVAEGRPGITSDVDVAIVVKEEAEDLTDQIYEFVAEIQDLTGMKVVPLLVDPSEIGSETQLGRAISRGEVLFERDQGS